MTIQFKNATAKNTVQANPAATSQLEWDHATGVARQVCARVFRDGGAPADALETFGLAHVDVHGNWRAAVDSIAHALCQTATSAEPTIGFKQAA